MKKRLLALAVCLTAIGFWLQISNLWAIHLCPGARPCWACRVRFMNPHRDPCLGGCFTCPGQKGREPVDGYCGDELLKVWSEGYVICYRRTNYRVFICCREDHGCSANPFQPNGQWGECLRVGYECEDFGGNRCPFMAWTYGEFCSEQDGRPCCDPSQPCRP